MATPSISLDKILSKIKDDSEVPSFIDVTLREFPLIHIVKNQIINCIFHGFVYGNVGEKRFNI